MSDQEIKKMIEDTGLYDEAKEDTLRSIVSDFYNRKMLSFIILAWAWGIAIIATAIYSAVKFFDSALAKDQILYATVFLTCVVFISMVKTFAWQMMHRNSIKREIKRLAIRLAELTESVRNE